MNYEEIARDHTRDDAVDAAAFVEAVVAGWVREYLRATLGHREIVEVEMANGFTYLYDSTHHPPLDEADNRVLGAWGRSKPPAKPRDASRMRGYPSPQQDSLAPVDRGHLIAHTIGGEYDMNLIPQDAALNRGIGESNRRWRELERYCAAHPGTSLLVRAIYMDNTDRPAELEYCVLGDDGALRLERFVNAATAG
ncbi:MAG: DNA/RNA non-specific endonuclease [Actinomycetota bacterium]|nr:DNA/RNA non-specific endonuclease [Actinomycetota bacterium]